MSILYNLPNELINEIFQYSGLYRNSFTNVIKELNQIVTFTRLKYSINLDYITMRIFIYIKDYYNQYRPKLIYGYRRKMEYIRYINLFTRNEIRDMFKNIGECSCCDTHLENCPKTIPGTWNRYPLQRIDHYPQVKTCLCPCRAYKRQLVRAYINE